MKQNEHAIQVAAIAQWRVRGASNSVIFAVPNGGLRDPATASRLQAEGVESGAPDLFAGALGVGFWIEVKTLKGRLSAPQKIMHRKLTIYAGMQVFTTYGLDQLIAVLERRGVLRANRACIMAA